MSEPDLARTKTQWLDKNDNTLEQFRSESDTTHSDCSLVYQESRWETIMGELAVDLFSDGCTHNPQIPDERRCDEEENSSKAQKQFNNHSDLESNREKPVPASRFSEPYPGVAIDAKVLGSARFISNLALLALRIIFLCAFGICIGMMFRMYQTLSTSILLVEVFVWMQLSYVIVLPALIYACLFEKQNPHAPSRIREDGDVLAWRFIGIALHVIGCFAQLEFIRFLILHFFPLCRPVLATAEKDVSSLYSMTSQFAFQRYLLLSASLSELIFCVTPQRGYFTIVFVGICSCVKAFGFFVLNEGKHNAFKVGLLFGEIALAILISGMQVIVSRMLSNTKNSNTSSSSSSDSRTSQIF